MALTAERMAQVLCSSYGTARPAGIETTTPWFVAFYRRQ